MLHAAAVALRLAVDRHITPRGTLGSALTEPPHKRVYAGDDPHRRPMAAPDLAAAIDAWLDTARTDPEPARHLMRFLTASDPGPANVAEQRQFLISEVGIPAEFLDRLSQ